MSAVTARHCGSLEFITRMPAATRRWLPFVVVGEAAQQLLLAGNHVEPGSDEIVELLQVAPQNNRGLFDLGQRRRAERGALEGGAQRFEAGHLDGDGSRDLAVLSLAGRRQHRRRGGGDPLGLARQLQGRERRRHPILGDAVDDIADLEEGVESGGGRQHREGADPEESEQQAAAYAEAFKHRGDALIGTIPLTRSACNVSSDAPAIGEPLFSRHVLSTPPDVPYPALGREVALVVEVDRTQHRVELPLRAGTR